MAYFALRSLSLLCFALMLSGTISAEENPLIKRLEDAHAIGRDFWVYNDISEAREVARRSDKPLFVTFRCVPCKACEGFDADVAQGSDLIADLAKKQFVSVRQVEMKGVDLSQFQFDYDLNWAAMFINADGTVYARYGTQSAEGPDAYNSIEGLVKTMRRVLALHENYPANRDLLVGKRGEKKPYRTALEMPGLQNREKLRGATSRKNCVHCHNLHDAEHFAAQESGKFDFDLLWRFPLPENLGLTIDAVDGTRITRVKDDSVAARAGLRAGQRLKTVGGQIIASIADFQWVLHNLPNADTTLSLTTVDGGKHTMSLAKGWKVTDISWRGSMWSVSPRLRVWMPEVDDDERRRLKIPEGLTALKVRWINLQKPGGRAARDSGLRQNDVVVAVNGDPINMGPKKFNAFVKLNYKVGEKLPVTVIRNGQRREINILLAE